VRYEGLEVYRVDLSLRAPIGTAAGTHLSRPVALVRVLSDDGDGWGECGALADGTSVDPPLSVVWRTLVDVVPGRLAQAATSRGGDMPTASVIAHLFDTTPPNRMAAAAVEMAVLDLELKAAGRSLADYLGVPVTTEAAAPTALPAEVSAGAMVGIPADRSVDTLLAAVERWVADGFGRVRVKVEPGWDVAPLAAVRRAFPEVRLQADANGAYRCYPDPTPAAATNGNRTDDDARRLAAVDDLDVTCVEQPLPHGDLPGHAALADLLATKVGLDESLTTVRAVADAVKYGACEVACLKPARLGGLLAARRAQARCREAGVSAFVGGLFDTGLARTANAVLSGLPGLDLPGDLSDPADYLVANPAPYPGVAGGRVTLPVAPGVGSTPDAGALSQLGSTVERFGPTG